MDEWTRTAFFLGGIITVSYCDAEALFTFSVVTFFLTNESIAVGSSFAPKHISVCQPVNLLLPLSEKRQLGHL